MEYAKFEIFNDYIKLKINCRNIRYDLYLGAVDYFAEKETNEDRYIKEFNNTYRQFQREKYLIRMKELLLKSNSLLPNTIIDNILPFL